MIDVKNAWARVALTLMALASTGAASAADAPIVYEPDLTVPDADLTFPVSSWSPVLTAALKRGPDLLDPNLDTGVASPPANDSPQTMSELTYLHTLQVSARTPYVLAQIDAENVSDLLVADMLQSQGFIPAHDVSPALWTLIGTLDHEVVYFALRDKMAFARARPTALDPSLEAAIPIPGHAAYPSGHASQFWAAALLLTHLNPDCESAYKGFGRDIATRREIAGVHYPSDSDAGRSLADHVVTAFLAGPWMVDMAEDLAREAQQPGGLGVTCPGPEVTSDAG